LTGVGWGWLGLAGCISILSSGWPNLVIWLALARRRFQVGPSGWLFGRAGFVPSALKPNANGRHLPHTSRARKCSPLKKTACRPSLLSENVQRTSPRQLRRRPRPPPQNLPPSETSPPSKPPPSPQNLPPAATRASARTAPTPSTDGLHSEGGGRKGVQWGGRAGPPLAALERKRSSSNTTSVKHPSHLTAPSVLVPCKQVNTNGPPHNSKPPPFRLENKTTPPFKQPPPPARPGGRPSTFPTPQG
jgi:hypothetical protein